MRNVVKDTIPKNYKFPQMFITSIFERVFDMFDFWVIFCTFVQSDIFDKSKVLLKPSVLVIFYSPINCRSAVRLEPLLSQTNYF